jgi:nucleoside-diphosphate-sugar epimerase
VTGDLREPASLDGAVEGRERIFHLAGVIQAIDGPDYEIINVQGTRNLVEACLRSAPGLGRFVFVSSVAAAGPSGPDRPGDESDEPRPVSAYGRSKLAAERVVLQAAGRLPVTILRPPNVIGPGSREIGRALALLRKGIFPVIGDGRPRTSLIDVDDLVEALILASASDRSLGQIYNVTDGRTYAWSEIAEALAEELGPRRIRLRVPAGVQLMAAWAAEAAARIAGRRPALTREIVRAGRDHFWLYDGSKICRELGFRPRSSMRDSIRRAVREARSEGGGAAGPRGAAG